MPLTMTDRTFWRLVILITVLAWGLRVAVTERSIGLPAPIDPADGKDELDYEVFAYQMSRGEGYVLEDGTPSARRPPGTSLVIVPVYVLFGRSLPAARLWFTFLSAINCAAAAWVVRRHCGPVIALLTASAMAVDPGLFYYALHLWSEVPFALAITLAVGCSLRAMELKSWRWTAPAGIAWGAATLLRPQIVLLAPCALIGLWWRREERKSWLSELVKEGLIVLAMISPWLARNWVVMGSPTMATLVASHTFWGSHNGSAFHDERYRGSWHPYERDPGVTYPLFGSETQQDGQAWDNGWTCLRLYWREYPHLLAWKMYRLLTPFEETSNRAVYWSFAAAWILTLPFILVGLPRLRRLDPALCWWIIALLCSTLLCTLMFYGAARFRHILEPFLMMAWAAGVESLISGIAGKSSASASLESRSVGEPR